MVSDGSAGVGAQRRPRYTSAVGVTLAKVRRVMMRLIGILIAFGLTLTVAGAAYAQDADEVLVDPENPGVV